MEKQAYDPVRAVASLSPASLQCPESAMRVLGSGYVGVVFLIEETGHAVKVMLEDFAEKEYDIICSFADAGLAVRPIGLHGPQVVPAGVLYSLHMEAIEDTLLNLLQRTKPAGLRRGLFALSRPIAEKIGTALTKAFQQMWQHGLVHGDLHLGNIAVKNHETQPLVQLIDFGRSARSIAPTQSGAQAALKGGHEVDVFRLIGALCETYDELHDEKQAQLKQCEREVKELQRECKVASKLAAISLSSSGFESSKSSDYPPATESQIHVARQIAGLQAFIEEERKALEQCESVYNTIVMAVAQYARNKLDVQFEGVGIVTNRKMRQAIAKRKRLSEGVYFKSNLFWQ
jgi:tRNA A-37 threonylcarbamoyl transferase component Bud32